MSHAFRRDFVLPPLPSSLPPPLVEAYDNVERRRGERQAVPMILPVIILFFFLVAFFTIYLFRDILQYMTHVWLVQHRGLRRRSQREEPPDLGPGLVPSILVSFPVFPYASIKRLKRKCGLVCAICLSEFSDDDAVRLLTTCNHAFHPECIDIWLASHVTCPVCRCNLDKTTEEDEPPCRISMEEAESSRRNEDKPPPNSSGASHDDDDDDEYTLRLPEDAGERMVYLRTASRSGSQLTSKNADHQSRS